MPLASPLLDFQSRGHCSSDSRTALRHFDDFHGHSFLSACGRLRLFLPRPTSPVARPCVRHKLDADSSRTWTVIPGKLDTDSSATWTAQSHNVARGITVAPRRFCWDHMAHNRVIHHKILPEVWLSVWDGLTRITARLPNHPRRRR